ncbi:RusA family crossover junction endodeoxyribonuclease [Lactobacillus gallinarum]|uniref:RusA family crossover junction endodeoxyribonuclease n=1 Tax=Lactobacillus gallinarum TaxID=52242 RepID=UPI001EF5581B|nr:RusA family crossover junction endodeoxyribonuclease [Lactobacillus gallinarum]
MAIFSFDIEPLAQARPRIAPRPYPHIYDPNNVKKYKEELHSLAVQKMKESGLKLFDGALFIKISFYRPIQKSVSKKEHARRSIGHVLPVKKPDLDNYIKSTLDALNGAIWTDDAIIVDMFTRKRYSEQPRIDVEVLEIG